MPVPRRRTSQARRDKRRTHYKLAEPSSTTKCKSCQADKLPHRACPECGYYERSDKKFKVTIQS